jgi:hypothetical protein
MQWLQHTTHHTHTHHLLGSTLTGQILKCCNSTSLLECGQALRHDTHHECHYQNTRFNRQFPSFHWKFLSSDPCGGGNGGVRFPCSRVKMPHSGAKFPHSGVKFHAATSQRSKVPLQWSKVIKQSLKAPPPPHPTPHRIALLLQCKDNQQQSSSQSSVPSRRSNSSFSQTRKN